MTREILVVNPRKKKKQAARKTAEKKTAKKAVSKKQGVKAMATKKTTKKRKVTRRKPRRNPSTRRAIAKRASNAARRTFGGMNVKTALKNVPAGVLGMMAAKWAAKRFGENTALETDPESWTAMDYVKGGIGAFAAGFAAQMIKPGWGQKTLEGGLMLMGYKLIQNELIPRSDWAQAQFGQSESAAVQYDEEGTPYLLGSNGQWLPLDERHRLPEASLGDMVVPGGGPLGDELSPPGHLAGPWEDAYLGGIGSGSKENDPFAKAFFR